MESLWKFHGENPRLGYGETVENLWNICRKTDMKKLWKTNTLENHRLENIKTR
jgi:hypothetical protein